MFDLQDTIDTFSLKEILSVLQVFADNFVRREILELETSCLNKDSGCIWQGKVKEVDVSDIIISEFFLLFVNFVHAV